MFELVIFLLYVIYAAKTLSTFWELFSIPRSWLKFWNPVQYQLEQDSWANLKGMLANKFSGKTRRICMTQSLHCEDIYFIGELALTITTSLTF